jgi:hypothetical protein
MVTLSWPLPGARLVQLVENALLEARASRAPRCQDADRGRGSLIWKSSATRAGCVDRTITRSPQHERLGDIVR